jgi:hypothetical protein
LGGGRPLWQHPGASTQRQSDDDGSAELFDQVPTASNARMGKLRVGHFQTDAEQAGALAQALLVVAEEYEQWQVTIGSQSSTTSCFDSESGG